MARGSRGREAACGAEDGDELPGDDDGLRAMRSVWLAMRDEAPPSGGLSELLAAARGKAAEMQPREPAWARLWSALRRPPVFALATALVVLGGALVAGRSIDSAPSVAGRSADRVAPMAVPAAAPGELGELGGGVAGSSEWRRGAPETPGIAAKAEAVEPTDNGKGDSLSSTAVPMAKPRRVQREEVRVNDLAVGRSRVDGTVAAPADEDGAGAATAGSTTVATKGAAPPARELSRQCEAAAARGDCVAVRRLMERITTDDGSRARLAKRSAIARCLDK